MINGKKIKEISEGVEIAMNIAGAVSGNIPIQVLANIPKVLVKLLEKINFFKNDMNDILQTQFNMLIQEVISSCMEKFESKRLSTFIEYMIPFLESNLSKDLTLNKLFEMLEENFSKGCSAEGLQITPKEIRDLSKFFIKELKSTILRFPELANHLEINILDNYYELLSNHEDRILNIENKIDEILVDRIEDFIFTEPTDTNLETEFVGRSNELQTLESLINNDSERKLILFSGMGGIGKTQICRFLYKKYLSQFHMNENTFASIGYMTYSNNMDETLYRSMKYKRTGNYEDDKETAWNKLYHISDLKRSLLIIDNVDKRISEDKSIIKLYNFNGVILLTSRFHDFGKFKEFPISSLEDNECINLFKSAYNGLVNDNDVFDLNEIIFDIVAKHTKTIILIANIANDQNWSIHELKINLKKCGFKLCYLTVDDEIANIEEEYMKLFNLAKLNSKEVEVLEGFSLFPYEYLNASYCNLLLAESNNELIFTILYKKGWLEKSENGFCMHPIISQTIFCQINNPAQKFVNLIEKIDSQIDVDESKMNSKAVPLLSFASSICDKLKNSGLDIMWDLLIHTGSIYLFLYSFSKCENYFEEAEKLINDSDSSFKKGLTFYKKSHLEYKRGNYEKSLENLNKAIPIFDVYSKDLYVKAKFFLGQQYLFEKEYIKSKQILEEVIIELKEYSDERYIPIVKTYLINALAGLNDLESAYEIAEDLYPNLDTIHEEDLYISTAYDLIANIYEKKNKFEKALQLKVKSAEIQKKIYGDDSIDVAYTYLGIGSQYHYLGKYKKAEESYNYVLDVFNQKLQFNHRWFAELYYNFGNLKIDMKDFPYAVKYLEKAVDIGEKIYGNNEEMLRLIYNELGIAYAKNNEGEKAVIFLSKALSSEYIIKFKIN